VKMPPLPEADLNDLLQRPLVAKFATYDRRGGLRITPVWFRSVNGAIHANTAEQTELARNLKANPECSVLVDVPDAPNVMGAHFLGAATVDGPADADGIAEIIERYVGSREGARAFAMRNLELGPAVYVRFQPRRCVAWDLRQVDPR
jgi:hypothetical protein